MSGSDLVARIDRIESHLAIQQLAFRYARSVDSRNIEAISALFSPRSNFGDDGLGAAGARVFYDRVLADFYRSFHQIGGHVIEFTDAESARGTVYCRAEHEVGEGWILNVMVYFDRYVRCEGEWCFLGRRARYLYVGDALKQPSSVAFNLWPGREGAFKVELPNSDPTWDDYWDERPEARERLTTRP